MSVVRHERAEGAATLRLHGDVDVDHAGEVYRELLRLARNPNLRSVLVDFSEVERLSSASVIATLMGLTAAERTGKSCRLVHLSDAQRTLFQMLPNPSAPTPQSPPRPARAMRAAPAVSRLWHAILELSEMSFDLVAAATPWWTGRGRVPVGAMVEQAVLIGVDALVIVAPLSLLVGIVLGFQSLHELKSFGAEALMSNIVGLGLVREFGPLMTAIIVSGRSGSAMAAELGTMAVNEELDALTTMSLHPVRLLVLPRMVAITVTEPIMSLMSMGLGMLGGVLAALPFRMAPAAVFNRMTEAVTLGDFGFGLFKSLLFAWIIGLTGCFQGLRTRGGAHSVGRATTRAVVISIFAIIVTDSVTTTLWTMGQQ